MKSKLSPLVFVLALLVAAVPIHASTPAATPPPSPLSSPPTTWYVRDLYDYTFVPGSLCQKFLLTTNSTLTFTNGNDSVFNNIYVTVAGQLPKGVFAFVVSCYTGAYPYEVTTRQAWNVTVLTQEAITTPPPLYYTAGEPWWYNVSVVQQGVVNPASLLPSWVSVVGYNLSGRPVGLTTYSMVLQVGDFFQNWTLASSPFSLDEYKLNLYYGNLSIASTIPVGQVQLTNAGTVELNGTPVLFLTDATTAYAYTFAYLSSNSYEFSVNSANAPAIDMRFSGLTPDTIYGIHENNGGGITEYRDISTGQGTIDVVFNPALGIDPTYTVYSSPCFVNYNWCNGDTISGEVSGPAYAYLTVYKHEISGQPFTNVSHDSIFCTSQPCYYAIRSLATNSTYFLNGTSFGYTPVSYHVVLTDVNATVNIQFSTNATSVGGGFGLTPQTPPLLWFGGVGAVAVFVLLVFFFIHPEKGGKRKRSRFSGRPKGNPISLRSRP